MLWHLEKGEIQIGFAARGIRASLACDLEREHMKPPPRFRDSVRRAVPVELLELGGEGKYSSADMFSNRPAEVELIWNASGRLPPPETTA